MYFCKIWKGMEKLTGWKVNIKNCLNKIALVLYSEGISHNTNDQWLITEKAILFRNFLSNQIDIPWSVQIFLIWYLLEKDGITGSMDMNLSKLWEIVKGREAWHAAVHEVAKTQTWLSNWTATRKVQVHHFALEKILKLAWIQYKLRYK